ncbi:pyridoxamine 5'-phosphate oxidase family protein [Mesobacterium sp. TK19101]|uniref:Pyridoxamine 5'-phosphate oxidase family protein n=1 Tax=Mesobacterium hydrothermale TaxID=3111907 RepID=A0ABU6HM71_9RHOB|nr:pyridoxamine 5'-phosphate oxidase family protein [Mesobacterium sp. TK19101]MEC3863202.1 pyridoxamine 5'-phosphate oxidase family protein [Mesobacterium sp. TK19101]
MAKRFDKLGEDHIAFINAQHIYFTGSAAPTGRVNVSPKGMDSLRVLGPNRILWLNLTGSGNETAGHLAQDPRMTLMWCSFTTRPLILRAYGTARAVHRNAPDWAGLVAPFGDPLGARQVYVMTVDLVQTSCGYAVPFMDHAGDRDTLVTWTRDKGEDGLRAYWASTNSETLDGKPTGIGANLE